MTILALTLELEIEVTFILVDRPSLCERTTTIVTLYKEII